MNTASRHPYEHLTPDAVIDALEGLGLACDGRLQALSSYENRVYQAHLEDGQVVVAKFYRPDRWSEAQILEEHAFAAELLAAEVPVVAPLLLQGRSLHQHAGFQFAVCPRRGGRPPELDDEEVLEWIGRFLARLHTVGAARPFAQRPALDLQSFGREPMDWLLAHDMVPLDVQSAWQRRCEEALALIAGHAALTGGATDIRRLRLHGDCHPGNILWTPDRGPHFVDLDDAVMGPVVQDLWMLLPGAGDEPDAARRLLNAVLDGYEQIAEFDDRELRLVEPLRTMRMIHHSAWLARRWGDPAFPLAFPWFGTPNYWLDQVAKLREQLEAMRPKDAPPPLTRDEDAVDFDGDGFA